MNLVSEARVNASNLMSPHMGAQVRAGAPGKSGPAAAREALVAMHGPVVALAFAHQPLDHALHERIVVGNAILDAGRDALERVTRGLDRLLILPPQEDTRVRPASLHEAGGAFGVAHADVTRGNLARDGAQLRNRTVDLVPQRVLRHSAFPTPLPQARNGVLCVAFDTDSRVQVQLTNRSKMAAKEECNKHHHVSSLTRIGGETPDSGSLRPAPDFALYSLFSVAFLSPSVCVAPKLRALHFAHPVYVA